MRAFPIGLMILGFMGIALVGITSPALPVNKVVIGVLDFETSGPVSRHLGGMTRVIMKELKQNRRVRLANIRESRGLSDLKRNGRKREEKRDAHKYMSNPTCQWVLVAGGRRRLCGDFSR